jgi:hypothetical protein
VIILERERERERERESKVPYSSSALYAELALNASSMNP